MAYKISLIGATGLVGQHCLEQLLNSDFVESVQVLSRRPLTVEHPKLQVTVCDFEALESVREALICDALISCLGTTIKQAGSQASFYRVDHDYVVEAANLARQQGCRLATVISAVGADPNSGVFYNRTKGEMERSLEALDFASLNLVRPSLLLGDRGEKRLAEDIGKPFMRAIAPAMIGPLRKYRPIEGRQVARAIVATLDANEVGLRYIYPSDEIYPSNE
ncbi:oxidoreductase htatip2 [gamma proteobacterium HTCC5015]|nr:oxidoreductase htatip2 [gamma proteobacterium HTCC5015]